MVQMTTWRKEITSSFVDGDTWDSVEFTTLSDEELDAEFDCGYGSSKGKPFTLWTQRYVYFPVVYDGAEWVEGGVPRNPVNVPTRHVGGE